MSRIGKKPIPIPSGVNVQLKNGEVFVEGPKGKMQLRPHPDMKVELVEGEKVVRVHRPTDSKRHKALHGLTRQLIHNMVVGVSQGFEKKLAVVGTGYSAKMQGKKLVIDIGFCHPVEVEPPQGIEVEVVDASKVPIQGVGSNEKRVGIVVRGIDKQKVGQFAANLRAIRPPEPYKGKGIRYADEEVRQKEGKALGGK